MCRQVLALVTDMLTLATRWSRGYIRTYIKYRWVKCARACVCARSNMSFRPLGVKRTFCYRSRLLVKTASPWPSSPNLVTLLDDLLTNLVIFPLNNAELQPFLVSLVSWSTIHWSATVSWFISSRFDCQRFISYCEMKYSLLWMINKT